MRRTQFSKNAHILHYTVMMSMLILQLPLFDHEDLMQDCPRFLYAGALLLMIATLAWSTALTTLHLAVTVMISLLIQAPVLMSLSRATLAFYDIFVSLNSLFVALTIFVAFSVFQIKRESDTNYL